MIGNTNQTKPKICQEVIPVLVLSNDNMIVLPWTQRETDTSDKRMAKNVMKTTHLHTLTQIKMQTKSCQLKILRASMMRSRWYWE